MNNNDYSMTEMLNIIENNNTKILSSYVISKDSQLKWKPYRLNLINLILVM